MWLPLALVFFAHQPEHGASPWAVDATESASYLVEFALGRYSSHLITDWELPVDFDHDDAASSLTDHPDVWTDGSLVLDQVTGVSSSGSGFFAHQAERFWRGCRWGHVDGVHHNLHGPSCRGFFSVPGPLQTVQRAEMWVVVLALQTSRAVHLGVDNLGVVRHVDRLLRGCPGPTPFELVHDGDLLLLIENMLNHRGLDTVRISKVKGHADDARFFMVRFVRRISWVMTLLMRLLILVVEGSILRLLMLVAICQVFVVAGTLLFLIFIGFSLLFLELWLIMMVLVVLLLIHLFGRLVLLVKGVGWFMRFVTVLFYLVRLAFGILIGFKFQLFLLVLRMLLIGFIPLVSWLSGFLS